MKQYKQREGSMGDQWDIFARNKLRYDDKSICDGSLKAGHSNSTFLTVPAFKRSEYYESKSRSIRTTNTQFKFRNILGDDVGTVGE